MRRFWAVLGLLVVLASGCSEREPVTATPEEQGGTSISLSTYPDPPVALQKTTFLVKISGGDGGPKAVVLDISMPGMYHGPNRPSCAPVDTGEYLCTGYFVMGGFWEVVVEIDGTKAKVVGIDVAESQEEKR